MSEWITKRLPTKLDAVSGRVLVWLNDKAQLWPYDDIPLHTPWQPIQRPEPYVDVTTVYKGEEIQRLQAVNAQMLEALKLAISYHVATYQEGQDDDETNVYMAIRAAIAAAEGRTP